ncbi:hypothetical protein AX15_002638 [Amanita polypyramis BW_CC]|nr:hypothetical protein AX15_002638 [Amanita polypyramis BW_CC]
MATRKSTKIKIPYTNEPITIVGILEQLEPDKPTHGRGIALILHGTMGHKNYLYQRRLAERFPLDSFRFDFRGNNESTGEWKYCDVIGSAADIQHVIDYLESTFGYMPQVIIGHSLGSLASFYWICHTSSGQRLPAFVHVSGRYRMQRVYESDSTKIWQKSFDEQGYHDMTAPVARQPVNFRIHADDFHKFANWDTSFIWSQFPSATDALIIHGLSDDRVPPTDALIYAKALSDRVPGTHSLHLVEGADHNYTGLHDELVSSILEWWELRQRHELKGGIWLPGAQQGTKL